ncbi:unnamed protein product, partial [Prorocentrum cordatum]
RGVRRRAPAPPRARGWLQAAMGAALLRGGMSARRIRCATRFATTATTEAMGRLQFQEHGWVPVSGCDPMSRGAQGPGGPSPPGGPGVSCCAHVATDCDLQRLVHSRWRPLQDVAGRYHPLSWATVAAVAALAVAAAVFARAYGWDGRQVWFLAT